MSSGWRTKPRKEKTTKTKTPATWTEGGGWGERRGRRGKKERRAGGRRALGAGAAAAGLRAWPNWSRETRAGAGWAQRRRLRAPGRASPAGEGTRLPQRLSNGPPSPLPGPGSRRPGTRSGPRPTTTPGSSRLSLPRPPSSPPPQPGRHSLREGGAARACASLTSTSCVTASGSGWRRGLPSADWRSRAPPPTSGGAEPTQGIWRSARARPRAGRKSGYGGTGPVQGLAVLGAGILSHRSSTFLSPRLTPGVSTSDPALRINSQPVPALLLFRGSSGSAPPRPLPSLALGRPALPSSWSSLSPLRPSKPFLPCCPLPGRNSPHTFPYP